MLGRASKFIQAGIVTPKPLIKIRNKYIFEWAIEAIKDLDVEKNAIFIISKEHVDNWGIDKEIKKVVGPKASFRIIDFIPQGAVKSVLLARDELDNDQELIIYNSDQYFAPSFKTMLKTIDDKIDGVIPFFHATHPRWSYVDTKSNGIVVRVAEKEAISNKATVGLYYFRKSKDFLLAADQMIEKNIMTNGEYYVCPVYNEFIEKGHKVKAHMVEEMWGLGTPEDVEHFEKYYKGDL